MKLFTIHLHSGPRVCEISEKNVFCEFGNNLLIKIKINTESLKATLECLGKKQ